MITMTPGSATPVCPISAGAPPASAVAPAPAATASAALQTPTATVVALIAHARGVPSAEREAFGAQCAALAADEAVILVHTCHRVELYVAMGTFGDRELPQLPVQGLRLEDAAAARHLISVACGLQSAVLGEDQVLHQVRETYASRRDTRPSRCCVSRPGVWCASPPTSPHWLRLRKPTPPSHPG